MVDVLNLSKFILITLISFQLCRCNLNETVKEVPESEPAESNPTEPPTESKPAESKPIAPPATESGALKACSPNPCKNSGLCHVDDKDKDDFNCACSIRHRGKDCEEITMHCETVTCQKKTDCLSTPEGAICICVGTISSRFCHLDLQAKNSLDSALYELEGDGKVQLEVFLGAVAVALLLLTLGLLVHCCRVLVKRRRILKDYKKSLERGSAPRDLPPDCFDISNLICKETCCCCKKDSGKVKSSSSSSNKKKKSSKLPSWPRSIFGNNSRKEEEFDRLMANGSDLSILKNRASKRLKRHGWNRTNHSKCEDTSTGRSDTGESEQRVLSLTNVNDRIKNVSLTNINDRPIIDKPVNHHLIKDHLNNSNDSSVMTGNSKKFQESLHNLETKRSAIFTKRHCSTVQQGLDSDSDFECTTRERIYKCEAKPSRVNHRPIPIVQRSSEAESDDRTTENKRSLTGIQQRSGTDSEGDNTKPNRSSVNLNRTESASSYELHRTRSKYKRFPDDLIHDINEFRYDGEPNEQNEQKEQNARYSTVKEDVPLVSRSHEKRRKYRAYSYTEEPHFIEFSCDEGSDSGFSADKRRSFGYRMAQEAFERSKTYSAANLNFGASGKYRRNLMSDVWSKSQTQNDKKPELRIDSVSDARLANSRSSSGQGSDTTNNAKALERRMARYRDSGYGSCKTGRKSLKEKIANRSQNCSSNFNQMIIVDIDSLDELWDDSCSLSTLCTANCGPPMNLNTNNYGLSEDTIEFDFDSSMLSREISNNADIDSIDHSLTHDRLQSNSKNSFHDSENYVQDTHRHIKTNCSTNDSRDTEYANDFIKTLEEGEKLLARLSSRRFTNYHSPYHINAAFDYEHTPETPSFAASEDSTIVASDFSLTDFSDVTLVAHSDEDSG